MKKKSKGKNKLDKLVGEFEQVLKKESIHMPVDYYITVAHAYFRRKQFKESLGYINKAIKLKPENYFVHRRKADILEKLEDYGGAIKSLDKAINLHPKDTYLDICRKGLLLAFLGRDDKAIQELKKASNLCPRNTTCAIYWYNLGNALFRRKCYKKASYYIDKAIEIDPRLDGAWDIKACIYFDYGKRREAIQYFKKAIKVNPRNTSSHFNLVRALKLIGHYKKALFYIDKAIKLRPKEITERLQLFSNKADILFELNRFDDALRYYDKILKIDPKNHETIEDKGIALAKLGKYSEALICLGKAIKIEPKCYRAKFNKADILTTLNRNSEALEKLIELHPRNSESFTNNAHTLMKLRRYQEALTSINKAIELNPLGDNAYYNKACILAIISPNKRRDIEKNLRKAIKLSPIYISDARKDEDFKAIRKKKWFREILTS